LFLLFRCEFSCYHALLDSRFKLIDVSTEVRIIKWLLVLEVLVILQQLSSLNWTIKRSTCYYEVFFFKFLLKYLQMKCSQNTSSMCLGKCSDMKTVAILTFYYYFSWTPLIHRSPLKVRNLLKVWHPLRHLARSLKKIYHLTKCSNDHRTRASSVMKLLLNCLQQLQGV